MPHFCLSFPFSQEAQLNEFVIIMIIFLINKDKIATCSKQTCSITLNSGKVKN